RGCRRSRGLRGEEFARVPEDARVLWLQRERRLGQRVDETRRAELFLAHGGERGVERGAGFEDGRLEGGPESGVQGLLETGGRVEVVGKDPLRCDFRGLECSARGLASGFARGERRLERGGADIHGMERRDV